MTLIHRVYCVYIYIIKKRIQCQVSSSKRTVYFVSKYLHWTWVKEEAYESQCKPPLQTLSFPHLFTVPPNLFSLFYNRKTKKSPQTLPYPLPYTTAPTTNSSKNNKKHTIIRGLILSFPGKKNPLRYKIEMPPHRRQPIPPPSTPSWCWTRGNRRIVRVGWL